MKLNNYLFLFLILPILISAGCVQTTKVSSDGFASEEQNISAPHPVEYEKNGTEYVVNLPSILDPGVWGVEGISHKDLDIGFFPFITDSHIKGYGMITESNWWADNIMRVMLVGRKSDIGKVVYVNRDGHFAYNVRGEEFEYDPDRLEKDPVYKNEIFSKAGMTIEEIEAFWRKYSESRGMEIPQGFSFVEEIQVGSPRWEEFKKQLETRLPQNYKMADGSIRQGYMSMDDFREEATKNHGSTPGQRFARNFQVSPFPPAVAMSFINSLIQASVGPVEGFYSLAECRRGDLKPRFREMSNNFKQLLMERDMIIYELQKKLEGRQ